MLATTDPNRKLKVFLCHASEDKKIVLELYHQLKEDGVDPWLDEVDMLPGQEWQHEIPQAVRGADAVLVCLSNDSIDKEGYIQQEAQSVLDVVNKQSDNQIDLILLRLEDCRVPNHLLQRQWIDLFDQGGYARLLESLRHRASRLELLSPIGASGNSSFVTESKPLEAKGNSSFVIESKPLKAKGNSSKSKRKSRIHWVAVSGFITALVVVVSTGISGRGLNVLNSFRFVNNITPTVNVVTPAPSTIPLAGTPMPLILSGCSDVMISSTVTLTGSGTAGRAVQIVVDGRVIDHTAINNDGEFAFEIDLSPASNVPVYAQALDENGYVKSITRSVDCVIATPTNPSPPTPLNTSVPLTTTEVPPPDTPIPPTLVP